MDVAVLVVLGLVLAVVVVLVVQHTIAFGGPATTGRCSPSWSVASTGRPSGRTGWTPVRPSSTTVPRPGRHRGRPDRPAGGAGPAEDDRRHVLEQAAGLTAEQARSELVAAVEHQAKRDAAVVVREIERTAQAEGEALAREIVVGAIQRLATEQTAESVVSVLHLPGDDMKGRIIGREGRNIRAFEQTTGVNLIIDDTPEAVLLSCFDPVRREIGEGRAGGAGAGRPDPPAAHRGRLREGLRRGRRACASGPARTRWSRSASPTCTPSWSRCSDGCTTARRTARTCSSTCSSRRTWPA